MFAVNKTTVYRLKAKFEEEGTLKGKKGPGRPRTTSKEQDEKIVQAHEDDPFLIPAKTTATSNVRAKLSDDGYENTD